MQTAIRGFRDELTLQALLLASRDAEREIRAEARFALAALSLAAARAPMPPSAGEPEHVTVGQPRPAEQVATGRRWPSFDQHLLGGGWSGNTKCSNRAITGTAAFPSRFARCGNE